MPGTIFHDCKHNSLRYHHKYHCKTSNVFFLFCEKCDKHSASQDWMRENQDYKKGIENLFLMINALGKDHVIINTVSIIPEIQEQQVTGVTDVEELEPHEGDDEPSEIVEDQASIHSIMVNKIPIGKACSLYEVIRVQTEEGMFPIVIIYDSGSEVILCNYKAGPLIVETKKTNKKVTISTIISIQAKLRRVHKLKVRED